MCGRASGRRVWLRVALPVLLILTILLPAVQAAGPAATDTGKDYYYDPALKGVEINVVWYEGPGTVHAKPHVQPFVQETGIKVNVIEIAESSIIEKQVLDFTGQTGAYDAVQTTMDGASVAYFAAAGWLEDLNPYLAKTPKSFNYEADYQEAVQAATSYPFTGVPKGPDAKTYALMQELTSRIFVYRTDLFNDPKEQAAFKAKYGRDLAFPKTSDELLQTAEFFNRPDQKLYGISFDGARDVHLYSTFIHFLWAFGGDEFDPVTKKVTLDTPEALKAADYVLKLSKFTPPGFSTASLVESSAAFAQGQAAMAEIWGAAYDLAAGKDSKVYDKTGVAEIPGGTRYIIAGVGMGINKFSKTQQKKDAAWSFITYITSPTVQLAMQKEGNSGPRKSCYMVEEIAKALPGPNLSTRLAASTGHPWTMASNVGTQLVDVIFTNLHRAIAGEVSTEQAMKDANTEGTKLFQDAGLSQ